MLAHVNVVVCTSVFEFLCNTFHKIQVKSMTEKNYIQTFLESTTCTNVCEELWYEDHCNIERNEWKIDVYINSDHISKRNENIRFSFYYIYFDISIFVGSIMLCAIVNVLLRFA